MWLGWDSGMLPGRCAQPRAEHGRPARIIAVPARWRRATAQPGARGACRARAIAAESRASPARRSSARAPGSPGSPAHRSCSALSGGVMSATMPQHCCASSPFCAAEERVSKHDSVGRLVPRPRTHRELALHHHVVHRASGRRRVRGRSAALLSEAVLQRTRVSRMTLHESWNRTRCGPHALRPARACCAAPVSSAHSSKAAVTSQTSKLPGSEALRTDARSGAMRAARAGRAAQRTAGRGATAQAGCSIIGGIEQKRLTEEGRSDLLWQRRFGQPSYDRRCRCPRARHGDVAVMMRGG